MTTSAGSHGCALTTTDASSNALFDRLSKLQAFRMQHRGVLTAPIDKDHASSARSKTICMCQSCVHAREMELRVADPIEASSPPAPVVDPDRVMMYVLEDDADDGSPPMRARCIGPRDSRVGRHAVQIAAGTSLLTIPRGRLPRVDQPAPKPRAPIRAWFSRVGPPDDRDGSCDSFSLEARCRTGRAAYARRRPRADRHEWFPATEVCVR